MIKISILKDGDRFAYMEYQSGNNPKIYSNTYGTTGYWDLEDLIKDLQEMYSEKGEEFILSINL